MCFYITLKWLQQLGCLISKLTYNPDHSDTSIPIKGFHLCYKKNQISFMLTVLQDSKSFTSVLNDYLRKDEIRFISDTIYLLMWGHNNPVLHKICLREWREGRCLFGVWNVNLK